MFLTNAVQASEHTYYLLHTFSISLTALYIIKEKRMNATFLWPVLTHVHFDTKVSKIKLLNFYQILEFSTCT